MGSADPILTVVIVSGAGVLVLTWLQRQRQFAIWRDGHRAWPVLTLMAGLLAVPMIVVDVLGGFPSLFNVQAPHSLLFYPTIALVAEITFHVLPVGAASLTGKWIFPRADRGRFLTAAIIAIALIEPLLQVSWFAGRSPVWVSAFLGVCVYVVNLTGLYLFRRFDFFTMYFFRFVYYAVWHVAWGYVRVRSGPGG